jgi:hypothetical protein
MKHLPPFVIPAKAGILLAIHELLNKLGLGLRRGDVFSGKCINSPSTREQERMSCLQ